MKDYKELRERLSAHEVWQDANVLVSDCEEAITDLLSQRDELLAACEDLLRTTTGTKCKCRVCVKARDAIDKAEGQAMISEKYSDMIQGFRMRAEIAESQRDALLAALKDMYSGWKYIRDVHGDLYGVGWDRCDKSAKAAIDKAEGRQ